MAARVWRRARRREKISVLADLVLRHARTGEPREGAARSSRRTRTRTPAFFPRKRVTLCLGEGEVDVSYRTPMLSTGDVLWHVRQRSHVYVRTRARFRASFQLFWSQFLVASFLRCFPTGSWFPFCFVFLLVSRNLTKINSAVNDKHEMLAGPRPDSNGKAPQHGVF